MKAEDLKRLGWTYDKVGAMVDGGDGKLVADVWAGGHDAQMDGAGLLLAAAPALALAAIEARRFAELAREGRPTEGVTADLIRTLDAALAQAGVEV